MSVAKRLIEEELSTPHNCGGWCEYEDEAQRDWCKENHPEAKHGHWCAEYDGLWNSAGKVGLEDEDSNGWHSNARRMLEGS